MITWRRVFTQVKTFSVVGLGFHFCFTIWICYNFLKIKRNLHAERRWKTSSNKIWRNIKLTWNRNHDLTRGKITTAITLPRLTSSNSSAGCMKCRLHVMISFETRRRSDSYTRLHTRPAAVNVTSGNSAVTVISEPALTWIHEPWVQRQWSISPTTFACVRSLTTALIIIIVVFNRCRPGVYIIIPYT